jgi:hypothetical protein
MEMIFKLQYDDNEYYLVNDMNITIATTDKILLKEDGDMGKLSLKNCQAIENGYDLDELINRAFDNMGYHSTVTPYEEKQFKLGYMVAFREVLEILGDKRFDEEDILIAIECGYHAGINYNVDEEEQGDKIIRLKDNLIVSLQQTEWDVEIVMDICGDKVYAVPEVVLDENGCLILKRK